MRGGIQHDSELLPWRLVSAQLWNHGGIYVEAEKSASQRNDYVCSTDAQIIRSAPEEAPTHGRI
jgi:hypothetical protein